MALIMTYLASGTLALAAAHGCTIDARSGGDTVVIHVPPESVLTPAPGSVPSGAAPAPAPAPARGPCACCASAEALAAWLAVSGAGGAGSARALREACTRTGATLFRLHACFQTVVPGTPEHRDLAEYVIRALSLVPYVLRACAADDSGGAARVGVNAAALSSAAFRLACAVTGDGYRPWHGPGCRRHAYTPADRAVLHTASELMMCTLAGPGSEFVSSTMHCTHSPLYTAHTALLAAALAPGQPLSFERMRKIIAWTAWRVVDPGSDDEAMRSPATRVRMFSVDATLRSVVFAAPAFTRVFFAA